MKKLIFLFFSVTCFTGTALATPQDSLLVGEWQLFKIIDNMTGNETVPPQPHDDFRFYIAFEDSVMLYNREINKCRNNYEITGPHQIRFLYYDECTQICCDKDFSKLLTYEECTGYFIKDPNTLVLVSEDRIFYFSRIKS